MTTVQRQAWAGFKNGAVLNQAASQFDVFVTGAHNLEYQQSYGILELRIVVLIASDNRVETILDLSERILVTIADARSGQPAGVVA